MNMAHFERLICHYFIVEVSWYFVYKLQWFEWCYFRFREKKNGKPGISHLEQTLLDVFWKIIAMIGKWSGWMKYGSINIRLSPIGSLISRPLLPEDQRSAGKVASVFWVPHGIIFIDRPAKVNKSHRTVLYDVIAQTEQWNKDKTAPYGRSVLYHHHVNAPPYSSLKALTKLDQLRYKLAAHPPYSPDLNPRDYYLFLKPQAVSHTFSIWAYWTLRQNIFKHFSTVFQKKIRKYCDLNLIIIYTSGLHRGAFLIRIA